MATNLARAHRLVSGLLLVQGHMKGNNNIIVCGKCSVKPEQQQRIESGPKEGLRQRHWLPGIERKQTREWNKDRGKQKCERLEQISKRQAGLICGTGEAGRENPEWWRDYYH